MMLQSLYIMDLKDLIKKAKSGDKEAFGQLYLKYYVPIFRYIYIRVNDKKETEDLTQTVFLKVYQSIDNYQQGNNDPLAYFFTVARNCVIDFYRRKKTVSLQDNKAALEVVDLKANLEENFIKSEINNELILAIGKLPKDQKEVIILKFISDLTNEEIARLMGKNEPAIRQIQHRALKKMQDLINKGDKK